MCECKLILCAFLVCNIVLVTSFNIDQLNYAVYGSERGTMFGFTVAVHKDRGNRGWVLVGAPEAQSRFQSDVDRGGAVYKCRTEGDDACEEVPFDTRSNYRFGTTVIDDKSKQWFGATLSSSGEVNGPVVACAPRYVWFTKDRTRRDPVGTCFVSNGAFDNFEEYSPCRTMNWGYHRQGSCQAGFSAAINRVGNRLYVGAPGSYYWQGQMYSIDAHAKFNYTPGFFAGAGYGAKGSVHQQSLETRPAVYSTREGSAPDDDSYMGYSTVVGHFRQGEQFEGIAVGMPRGNTLQGKVLLFTWNLVNYKNITISNRIGSYFGYSMAVADVNGDGLLDIIVGAPIHTEPNNEKKYDVGRVYIFYQSHNVAESYTEKNSHYLDGINSTDRFGHSVASLKDLNRDGFEDFAVGAPYGGPNGRGAVYIFYGSKDGVRKKHGQVIYAEAIQTRTGRSLSTFGFSLSGGMDLDGNEYPDMAVGSYLSDTAFFFRSRPVVVVDAFVRFQTANKQIDIKSKNCVLPGGEKGTCTAIDFCIKYSGKGIPDQLYLTVKYILDSKKLNAHRMRFKNRETHHTFEEKLLLRKDNPDYCKTEEVYIKSDIRDKLTPLEAEVKYFMADEYDVNVNQYERNPRSQLKPVIDLNNPPSKKDSIVIQKNCGADNICTPNIHVNISTIEKYLLGSSRNLELDVTVSNFGEDSFETTFQLQYPEGIHFGKVESAPNMPGVLCSNPLENRTIDCDIGNPLPGEKIITFKLILQPFHEEGMPSTYEFEALVNNSNPGVEVATKTNRKHISVLKWVDATLELEGTSYPPILRYNESSYKKTRIQKESDIGPEVIHFYYLTNKGPADIEEAEILLMWPSKTLGGEYLLYLLEQPHVRGNVKCNAVAVNAEAYTLDIFSKPIWKRFKMDTTDSSSSYEGTIIDSKSESESASTGVSGSHTFSGKGEQKIQTETGGGVSSGVGVVNRQNTDEDIKKNSGDASLVFERRHNETFINTESLINSPNGEHIYREAKVIRVFENGRLIERWQNRTIVKDNNGKILRTYASNDWDDVGRQPESFSFGYQNRSQSQREEQERIRQANLLIEQNRIREQQRLLDKQRAEEDRLKEESRVREEAHLREKTRLENEAREREETRRQDEWIREQERIREEERRRTEGQRPTSNSQDEYARRQEQQRREEERKRQEEERIQQEWKRQEEQRREQEWRRQEEQRRQDELRRREEEERIRNEEWRREQEKIRRLEEEKRRQTTARPAYYPSGEHSWRTEEERRRYEESIRNQGWNRSREENSYKVGGGDREGGSQSESSIRGYYDERGVFHPTGGTYNFSFTVEHSTSIPIELPGTGTREGNQGLDFGESSGNNVLRVQTLDLGNAGSESRLSGSGSSGYDSRNYGQASSGSQSSHGSSSSSGSYSRDWSNQGSFSHSGQIPPTYLHNTIEERDNVDSRSRNKRQAQVIETFPCNSTKCMEIRCTVGRLAKNEEIAIALRSRLNVRAVNMLITQQPVKISSMMKGTIRKLPYLAIISDSAAGLDDKRKKEVFTEIAGSQEVELVPEVAPLWIYVISAVAGTVMLLLLIWILSKCGFFKRNRPSSAPERQPLNRNGYHNGDEAL